MVTVDVSAMVQQCAPQVHPATMQAIVRTESGGNPYAIGVVGGRLARQPRTLAEAVATAASLEQGGWNYSVGLAQVNRSHFAQYGLTGAGAFDACQNLMAGADILSRCYTQAARGTKPQQVALRDGLSCYYSGNFTTGYRTGYVQRVVMSAAPVSAQTVVPAIDTRGAIPVIPTRSAGATNASHSQGDALKRQRPASGSPAGEDAPSSSDDSAVIF